jgi:hypothetical protein
MPPVMQKMQGECQDPCEATQVLGSDIRGLLQVKTADWKS